MLAGMGKREQSKEHKRQKILQSSRRIFAEKGYHNTSISDIIRDTELARGTFYLYYKDKEDIFDSILSELTKAISTQIFTLDMAPAGNSDSFYQSLRQMAKNLFKVLGEHRELVQVIITTPFGADTEFDKKVEGFFDILTNVARLMIKRGIQAGYVVDHNLDLFSYMLVGTLREIVFQWIVKDRFSQTLEAEADQIIEIFMKGVEPRDGHTSLKN